MKNDVTYTVVDIEDPSWSVECLVCGAYVRNGKLHDAWHKKLESDA